MARSNLLTCTGGIGFCKRTRLPYTNTFPHVRQAQLIVTIQFTPASVWYLTTLLQTKVCLRAVYYLPKVFEKHFH